MENDEITIILVNGNRIQSSYIESLLDPNKFNVKKFYEQNPACEYLHNNTDLTKVVIVSYQLNQGNGLELIKNQKSQHRDYPFIFLSSDNTIERVVEAMQAGAMDFLSKTYGLTENLIPVIQRAYQTQIKILERKEIEDKLAHKNKELAKLSVVASETSNAVTIFNSRLELEWVNKAFVDVYGYNKEEFISKKGNTLPQQSDNENINRILQECIMKKKSITFTNATQTKYADKIWMQSTISPVVTEKSIIEKFVVIETDITEIKKAERKIIIQQRKINDSLNYAERIQSAILPTDELISHFFDKYFIYFAPREKVSGDFPWFYEKNGLVYIAAIDCTGHGVPGAFLSFIGHSNLMSIIDSGETETDEILLKLNKKVRQLLSNSYKNKNYTDGMELALCRVDFENKEIQFTGASRPLFMIKDKELIIYKGNIMPIGGFQLTRKEENYTVNSIKYNKGDRIYLFSDGIQDQFKDGDSRKKYSTKRLKEFLSNSVNFEMEDVYKALSEDIKDWKNGSPQTDDMLLMGFEF
ncbi:MAG: SpoIIE family protein phosphatase [Bacteroidales bacterium]|nr:SpoIIE family protein phosphatase [Bacteroidales bacterium]